MDQNHLFDGNNFIISDNEIYRIQLYDPSIKEYRKDTAYLYGDCFYLYRGILDSIQANNIPGIYYDITKKKYTLIEAKTDLELDKFSFMKHISTYDAAEIIRMINHHEVEIKNLPDSSKQFTPVISETDDILKRLIKQAIIAKDLDIDFIRERFADKNALFNFKQVLKSDSTKLSMLLFDRGIEALNLRYTILIDEIDPDRPIGKGLPKTIIASSDDTYEL